MKKYNKPAVEVEKFSVEDVVTGSSNPNIDADIGDWNTDTNSAAIVPNVSDEF